MVYSDFYFQPKKKFSLIIVALAVLSIFSFSLFFFGFSSPVTRASKKILKRHEIVNLSTNQTAVFWQTEKKEIGWIVYGDKENSLNITAFDERDVGDSKNTSYYHYVLLKGLEKDKVYFYKIVSNNEVVSGTNDIPFSFKTPKNISNLTSVKPAYGKVIQSNGLPSQNSFVVYNYPNAYPLITLTKTTGEWLIPLQSVVDKKIGEPVVVNEEQKVKIEIFADDLPSSVIEAPVKKTNPFPQTIISGKDYTLDNEEDVLPASTSRSLNKTSGIEIILPKEGSLITTVKPRLKGTALAGKEVELAINSNSALVFRQKISADKQGGWVIDNPNPLLPGSYTLTMVTEDEKGKKITIERNFLIAKSGEQVQGVATETASLTPTTILTLTPVPTSEIVTPTVSTISPTPPVSGLDSKIFMYMSFGLIILGAGFLIVF